MITMVLWLCLLLFCIWVGELIGYIVCIPEPTPSPMRNCRWCKQAGTIAYGTAYLLSLLRAPLGLLPYLVKLWLQIGLKMHYEARETTYGREVLNMISEIANLLLTWFLVRYFVGPLQLYLWIVLCYLPLWAESIRLLAERIPILFSTAWQLAPHRRIAAFVELHISMAHGWRVVTRYCRYYQMSDNDRATYILEGVKQMAMHDSEFARKLAYLNSFRIVPQKQGLRGGMVRDVAQGEVFVHGTWTADPWLMIGMALRRSPWPFDPRYLRRPFYYMSEANRVTTLFVLQHARYMLPFALFQFGHEIRVARLHCFYVLLRWLGSDIERKVWADGTFQNDQCIFWLKQRLGYAPPIKDPRPLYNDSEVLAELKPEIAAGYVPSIQEISERYVYPQIYVQEVLLPLLTQQKKEIQDELSVSS